jgi:hypothetical protein
MRQAAMATPQKAFGSRAEGFSGRDTTMSPFSGTRASELLIEYLHSIRAESDRGAVVAAAALLDAGLEAALVANGCGPLPNSFAGRIDLAFSRGLFPNDTRQMLHLFRTLRNDFAHDPAYVSLESADVGARLDAVFASQQDVHRALLTEFQEAAESEPGIVLPPDIWETPRMQREVFNFFFALNAMVLRRIAESAPPKA